MAIPMRTRKLIGTVLLLIFLFVYSLVAMVVGVQVLPAASPVLEFTYYLLAGLAWVPVAGLLISWMARPDNATDAGTD